MTLIKNFYTLFKYFGIKGIGVLCSSIIIFYLQKKYGTETQGYYGVLSNSILLLTILSHFGIPSFVSLQMAYYSRHTQAKIKKVVSDCLKTIIIIQPLFIPLLVYQFYNLTYSLIDVCFFCIIIPCNVLIYFYAFVLRGSNEYGWMIYLTEASRWIVFLFVLLLLGDFFEIKKLIVYSFFTSSLVTLGFAIMKVRSLGYDSILKLNHFNLKRIKSTVINSSALMVVSFGVLCLQQINIIQLSYYKTIEDVGVFNFTFKYLMLTIMPVSVISAKYAHLASELYFANKFKELKKMLIFSSLISFIVTMLALVFLYFLSSYVYTFVNQQFDLKLYLVIGISMVLVSLYGFFVSFLTQIKKAKQIVIMLVVAILFNLIVNCIITPKFSYYGTAFSDIISNFIALLACSYLIFNFFKK